MQRRTFLTVAGLSPIFLNSTLNAAVDVPKSNKKVVYIWLSGGASHIETFNPIPDATVDYRSVTGYTNTDVAGIQIGGSFTEVARLSKLFSFVRGYSHNEGDHSRATGLNITGMKLGPNSDQTLPSVGSMISNVIGNSAPNGLPTYIRKGRAEFDGAAFLGSNYSPFDMDGDAKKNFLSIIESKRLAERTQFLAALDQFQKSNPKIRELDAIKGQAFDIILGDCKNAFMIEKEPQQVRDLYGAGLGETFLLTRRLLDYGAKFVQINHGGWDMHQDIKAGFDTRAVELDKVLGVFINDLQASGMLDDTLIVLVGDFGRTKLNNTGGRDHYPKCSTLAFAGGKYNHGQIIGETDKNAMEVKSGLCGPNDLIATILKHFDIPLNTQRTDRNGRPRYLQEGGKSIL